MVIAGYRVQSSQPSQIFLMALYIHVFSAYIFLNRIVFVSLHISQHNNLRHRSFTTSAVTNAQYSRTIPTKPQVQTTRVDICIHSNTNHA